MEIVDGLYCVRAEQHTDADEEQIVNHHTNNTIPRAFTAKPITPMRLMHTRLAHFSENKIRASIKHGAQFGFTLSDANVSHKSGCPCKGCLLGKAKQPHHARQPDRKLRPGQMVHSDIKVNCPVRTDHELQLGACVWLSHAGRIRLGGDVLDGELAAACSSRMRGNQTA
ncbi:hypothetical protein NFJ02_32g82430 [Pycnococcus provasolii]